MLHALNDCSVRLALSLRNRLNTYLVSDGEVIQLAVGHDLWMSRFKFRLARP
jgi:hypothetical protein